MSSTPLRHLRTSMSGRDPHESGRAASSLELLFDLTFVIAFGTAADELAHALAAGQVADGLLGFAFATFAVSWAWINFSWFASAYDTDDWTYRLTTMVQMVGVLVLALGLPDMFASLSQGDHVDNSVMVLGYVVMRVPMIGQWWRAGRQDPERRSVCRQMVTTLVVAQIGWVGLLVADLPIGAMFPVVVVLVLIELAGPVLAEGRGAGTPWHPHHIAERYGLMVIITLGEGLLGTMAALQALVARAWTLDVAVLGLAGVAVTFGMWWMYFVVPAGDLLHARRERSFGWGYGQIPIFGAIVAVGAGLHVAAYFLAGDAEITLVGTVLTVAVPLVVYVVGVYLLYAVLTRSFDPFHLLLVVGSLAVVAVAVALAALGASLSWSLLVLALTPWVTVIGYETVGHRHSQDVLANL